jgi:phosphoglycerol transferase
VCAILATVFGIFQIAGLWNKLGISEHLSSLGEESTWIEDNYVDPSGVSITFPEKKKNLIEAIEKKNNRLLQQKKIVAIGQTR